MSYCHERFVGHRGISNRSIRIGYVLRCVYIFEYRLYFIRDRFLNGKLRIIDEEILEIFSSTKMEKDAQEDMNKMPKILHFIWLGSKISMSQLISIAVIAKNNLDWQVNLWIDDNNVVRDIQNITTRYISEIDLVNKKIFDEEKMLASKADILRYEIVYKYGGMYLDIDCTYHRSFDHNFEKPFVVYYEIKQPGIQNCMFGFEAGSKFLKYLITCLSKSYSCFLNDESSDGRAILKRTGTYFFLTCFLNYNSENINMMKSWVIDEDCHHNNKFYVKHSMAQTWNWTYERNYKQFKDLGILNG